MKYITFARTINPAFDENSRKSLVECYRLLRSNDILGKNKTAYRITVRQLESLIRLSEALARLHLDTTVRVGYVNEAHRLLQRSIIFVESEDIDLDEAEAGADFGDVMDTDYETQIPSDILDEVYASTVHADAPSTNAGAIAASTGEKPPAAGDAMEVSETAPAAAKKPKAAKTQMTAKEYDEIKALLTLRLKTLEEEDPDGFQGSAWKDLVAWYLKQYESQLTDNAEIDAKKKVIGQVIRRIIKHEGNILVAGGSESEQLPNEEKILKLHPSYQI